MARKSNGRGGTRPVRDSREFTRRVRRGGGTVREASGSHFVATLRDGSKMTAYHSDSYPRGIGMTLAKWLAAAGLVLAVAWWFC